MSDETQKYIAAILELMAQKQFLPASMNDKDRRELETSLGVRAGELIRQYENERLEIENLAPDNARRKEFEKLEENLAKALPNITKGTLAAITAFQNGDAITGSAAVMDICASLAPMLGALSAAGGPPGMLVGAIFAMIGQILSFFAPKSESLTSQIAKLLRELRAEEMTQEIKAVHTNITNYASSLKKVTGRIETALDKPGLQIMVISQIIKDFNPIDGPTITRFWEVAEWLQEEKNQDQDQWPTILAAVCQAYTDLLETVVTLMCLISTDSMAKRYSEAERLPETEKRDVQRALTKLLALGIARLIEYCACSNAQLEYLRRAVPAAQNRGMFWMIGENARLYAGTNIKQGTFSKLGGEGKRISVVVPRKDIGSPRPTYYTVGVEYWGTPGYDRTYISEIKPPYEGQDSKQLVDENGNDYSGFHSLSDIWTEPGDKSNNIRFYTAKGKVITGYSVDIEKGMNKARGTGYTTGDLKADVKSVRVLHNPQAFLDDPDNTPGIMTGVDYCVYGGLARENSEIYVDIGKGKSGYVPSPWGGYDGLGVDQHYLWVFGSGGCACATHASVMRCLKGESQKPRWMLHYPNELLYTKEYHRDQSKVKDGPPLRGLVDLCPCDDGTIAAALYTRSVKDRPPFGSSWPASGTPVYEFIDTNALYSGVHHIDLKSGNLRVEWTKIEVSTGIQVQKLPIFCWTMFGSLTASLEKLGPALRQLKSTVSSVADGDGKAGLS